MVRIRLAGALLVAFAAFVSLWWHESGSLLAQVIPANPVGMWRAEVAGRSWTAVLRVDGPRLLGVVSSCTSYPADVAISEGRVDGSTITFKCTSPDGARTLTFRGQLEGNRIAFTWEKTGSGSVPYDAALFGAGAPSEFSATFVPNRSNTAVDRTRTAPTVTFEHILRATETPQNWLTYSGNLQGHRYSPLADITAANVKDLSLAWLSQITTTSGQRSTPLVVDGVIYTTRNTNDVVALDGETGRVLWVYPYAPMQGARASGGGGRPNRGLAISAARSFSARSTPTSLRSTPSRASRGGTRPSRISEIRRAGCPG